MPHLCHAFPFCLISHAPTCLYRPLLVALTPSGNLLVPLAHWRVAAHVFGIHRLTLASLCLTLQAIRVGHATPMSCLTLLSRLNLIVAVTLCLS